MGIYEPFGVTPIINASGAVTRLGGAPMPDEVLKAFNEAARASVPLEQLQAAASKVIAEATGDGSRFGLRRCCIRSDPRRGCNLDRLRLGVDGAVTTLRWIPQRICPRSRAAKRLRPRRKSCRCTSC